MAKERINIYLPPGRFISGDLTKVRTKTARNQDIPPEKQQYEFGIALAKTSPDTLTFLQSIMMQAKTEFNHLPEVHPVIDAWWNNGMQGFSMKISDGDKPNAQGKVNPNSAGHFVVWLSSSFPITCADHMNNQIDPNTIERGFFVDGTVSIAANKNVIGDGIGVYMNPVLIRFIGVGEIIRGGIDVAQIAASMPSAPQMPAGASAPGSAPGPSQMPMGVQQPPMQQPPVGNGTSPAIQGPGGMSQDAPVGTPGLDTALPMGTATTASPSNAYGQPQPTQTGQPPAYPGIMNPQ